MKRKEKPEVNKNTTIVTLFWGGLKSGQEVGSSSTFLGPNISFLNFAKTLFLMHFQGKLVVAFFWGKAMLEKGAKKGNCFGCL